MEPYRYVTPSVSPGTFRSLAARSSQADCGPLGLSPSRTFRQAKSRRSGLKPAPLACNLRPCYRYRSTHIRVQASQTARLCSPEANFLSLRNAAAIYPGASAQPPAHTSGDRPGRTETATSAIRYSIIQKRSCLSKSTELRMPQRRRSFKPQAGIDVKSLVAVAQGLLSFLANTRYGSAPVAWPRSAVQRRKAARRGTASTGCATRGREITIPPLRPHPP